MNFLDWKVQIRLLKYDNVVKNIYKGEIRMEIMDYEPFRKLWIMNLSDLIILKCYMKAMFHIELRFGVPFGCWL